MCLMREINPRLKSVRMAINEVEVGSPVLKGEAASFGYR